MGTSSGTRVADCCSSSSTGSGRSAAGSWTPAADRGTSARAARPRAARSAGLGCGVIDGAAARRAARGGADTEGEITGRDAPAAAGGGAVETASQPPCPVGLAGPVWTSRYPGGTDAGRVRQGPIVAGSAEGGCRNPEMTASQPPRPTGLPRPVRTRR